MKQKRPLFGAPPEGGTPARQPHPRYPQEPTSKINRAIDILERSYIAGTPVLLMDKVSGTMITIDADAIPFFRQSLSTLPQKTGRTFWISETQLMALRQGHTHVSGFDKKNILMTVWDDQMIEVTPAPAAELMPSPNSVLMEPWLDGYNVGLKTAREQGDMVTTLEELRAAIDWGQKYGNDAIPGFLKTRIRAVKRKAKHGS